MSATRWILCAMALAGAGCLQDLPPVPAVDRTPLAVGERRQVELGRPLRMQRQPGGRRGHRRIPGVEEPT